MERAGGAGAVPGAVRHAAAARLTLTGADRAFARTVYREFVRREGSQHIATRRAIAWLAACLRVFRPARVLELGPGIGTLTFALLTHEAGVESVVATERNRYCLELLRNDPVLGNDRRLRIVTSPEKLARLGYDAELIVGDGGFYSEAEAATAREGTVVFIEGVRVKLRRTLSESLAARGLSLAFRAYGRLPIPKLGLARLKGIPLPRVFLLRKGCWVGVVQPGGASGGG